MTRRISPESASLKKRIMELVKYDDAESITALGFSWQRVFTVYGSAYALDTLLLFRSKTTDRCPRAVLYTGAVVDGKQRFQVLEVGGQQRVYATQANYHKGSTSWASVDEGLTAQMRRFVE